MEREGKNREMVEDNHMGREKAEKEVKRNENKLGIRRKEENNTTERETSIGDKGER